MPEATGAGEGGNATVEKHLETLTGGKKCSTLSAEPEAILDPTLKALVDYIRKTTTEAAAPIGISPLCTPEVEAMMTPHEREFVTSPEGKSIFQSYRFDMPCGSTSGSPFNDAADLQTSMIPSTWPRQLEINLVKYWWGDCPIVGWYEIHYGQLILRRGSHAHTVVKRLSISLSEGELITKVRLAVGEKARGVSYVEVMTSQGQVESVGDAQGRQIIERTPPTGFLGLKGFYGGKGSVVDRMGAIWGQNGCYLGPELSIGLERV